MVVTGAFSSHAGRSRVVAALVFVAVLCTGASLGLGQTSQPAESGDPAEVVFYIDLKKGQHIFIGADVGKAGKHPGEIGLKPIEKAVIDPESKAEGWRLEIVVRQEATPDGVPLTFFTNSIQTQREDGSYRSPSQTTWQDPLKTARASDYPDAKREAVELKDESESSPVRGVRLFRIPYCRIKGEVHSLVIAIGDNGQDVSKSVTVSRAFFLFDWNEWFKVK